MREEESDTTPVPHRSNRVDWLHRGRLFLIVAVAVASAVVFLALLDHVSDLTRWILDRDEQSAMPTGMVPHALKALAAALFAWRVVKVTVFLGSPFPFGLSVERLRENGAENGRPVTVAVVHDPDYRGLRFGVLARSHARSDKLVRSRIETLIIVLWARNGLTFIMHGSRISIRRVPRVRLDEEWFGAWRRHDRYWIRRPMEWDGDTVKMIREVPNN